MTDLLVRDVVPADAAAIIRILNPIIETRAYTVFDAPFSLEAERDYIVRFPPRGIWKVAVDPPTGAVVGFQVLEPFGSYTRAFDHVGTLGTYVDREHRRRGIAKALFAATFAAARQKGYEKIFTFVRADNPVALATYRAHGFGVIGRARRHTKIDGRYVDEVLIEKILAEEVRDRGASLDLVTVIVDDYDPAIAFFVGVLGFELIEDLPSTTTDGRPKRWIVVRPAGGRTGVLLARADGDHQRSAVGQQFAGRVGLFLRVDDFDATHARLAAAGVTFVRPPRDEPYGKVAVFLDIAGNRWDLLGPRRDGVV